jgi:hypothetical protein
VSKEKGINESNTINDITIVVMMEELIESPKKRSLSALSYDCNMLIEVEE